MPLGVEDYRIPSGSLQASSSWNYNHGPDRARINFPSGHSRSGAWVARGRNTNQWLQVELDRPAKVTGVATQGRHDGHQWVTSYIVSYSLDGKSFKAYLEFGRTKVGNYFYVKVLSRLFSKSIWGIKWNTLRQLNTIPTINWKKIENVCCKVTDDSGIQISLDVVVSLFSSFFKVYQSWRKIKRD